MITCVVPLSRRYVVPVRACGGLMAGFVNARSPVPRRLTWMWRFNRERGKAIAPNVLSFAGEMLVDGRTMPGPIT